MINIQEAVAQSFDRVGQRRFVDGRPGPGPDHVFYLFTSWAAISSYGVHHAQATAAANPSMFIFAANAKYVGGFTTDAMQILVVTSLFAAFLAFH